MALHTQGYIVHKAVLRHLVSAMPDIDTTSKSQSVYIFNNKKRGGDKKRLQLHVPIKDQDNAFCQMLFQFLKRNYPNHTANTMVHLISDDGCSQQVAHADYEPTIEFARSSDAMVPLGCLVAISPGTKLVVWPESIRLSYMSDALRNDFISEHGPISSQEICLEPGDILIFRGDLIHAGAAYDKLNVRIHVYLDSPDVSRMPNRTWFPSDDWITQ